MNFFMRRIIGVSQEPGLVVPALMLSECGALAQGICSLEALTSLIVTCGV